MSKIYYGFEHYSGLNTTTGTPNRITGNFSIAGNPVFFSSKSDRDLWVEEGEITSDMAGNCRRAVNKTEARALNLGMTVQDYEEFIEQNIDDSVVECGYRMEGNHLYKYSESDAAYIHVYQNHRCSNLEDLVAAYQRQLEMNAYEEASNQY